MPNFAMTLARLALDCGREAAGFVLWNRGLGTRASCITTRYSGRKRARLKVVYDLMHRHHVGGDI